MARSFDAVVVGAGIVGASTAHHLRQAGLDVLLLERETAAAGGTGKSAAIIRQHYSTPVLVRLTMAGIAMMKAMPEIAGRDGAFVQRGWYFLVPAGMRAQAEANQAMQRGLGVDTRTLDAGEIAETMPWLDADGIERVIFEPEGGYADPVQVTEAFVAAFEAAGGHYRTKTPVRRLLREGDRVCGVETDDGAIAAGIVVNAAGPWARGLAESAGLPLPLRAVREQDTVWQARGNRPLPAASISNAVDADYLRPLGQGRFVIGRGYPKDYVDVDPNNYKLSADDDFARDVQARVERRFPPFAGMSLIAAYAALYDVTPDWYPFYGPRAGIEGYADACGGSGHGFKIGLAAGAELARWLATGEVADDFAALSHDRIAANRLFTNTFAGNRG